MQWIQFRSDDTRLAESHSKVIRCSCHSILVPTVGLWPTYWERDHADREVKRQKYEYAVKQHDEFVRAIGEPLLDGKFN